MPSETPLSGQARYIDIYLRALGRGLTPGQAEMYLREIYTGPDPTVLPRIVEMANLSYLAGSAMSAGGVAEAETFLGQLQALHGGAMTAQATVNVRMPSGELVTTFVRVPVRAGADALEIYSLLSEMAEAVTGGQWADYGLAAGGSIEGSLQNIGLYPA